MKAFTAPIDHCDKLLLRDYAQVLIEKCNFTLCCGGGGWAGRGVRLREIRQSLRPNFGKPIWVQKALWLVVRMFLKYYLKRYKMSERFSETMGSFLLPITGAGQQDLRACDLDLGACVQSSLSERAWDGLGHTVSVQSQG